MRFILVLMTIPCLSCESKLDRYLKKVDSQALFNNNYKDWTINQEITEGEYSIYKYDGDTLKTLVFVLDNNDVPVINLYEMTFPCNKKDTCFVKMEGNDTLFYYSQNMGVKNFFVGEYVYRWYKSDMGDEYDYYYLYEDSLRKVKGNNLPKLPSLNELEKEKLNLKIAKERN